MRTEMIIKAEWKVEYAKAIMDYKQEQEMILKEREEQLTEK
ncbi:hypothetical protein bcgnr5378_04590 [Bacillus cereus]|uniref:Uncharacterized protein n=1 Tax=Bacillus cereus TaxID=1396 RepID=A0A164LFA4_BACCE|nr:hypothetical protein B4088_5500 [Bacillus cereus]